MILRVIGMRLQPLVVTAVHLYRYDAQECDDTPTAICGWCGQRLPLAHAVADTIHAIGRNSGIVADITSPCATLPIEAWNEPRLLSHCPGCSGSLRVSFFVVDNREQYAIWHHLTL